MSKKTWKEYLLKEYLARAELRLNGVQIEGEELLIPINLDAALVESEFPDDLDKCLSSIDDAFKNMIKMHPYISQIVTTLDKNRILTSL